MEKKLKICFIGTAASTHALKWAKYFSDKGHKVFMISYAPLLENYDCKGIEFYFLKKIFPIDIWPFNTLLNLPFSVLKAKRIIKRIKPDLIHAHYVSGYGTLASIIGFHPFVLTAWGSDILITPNKNIITKKAIKKALKRADLITCDAEHMIEAMEKLGADSKKIKIINFGVDTEKFSPGEKKSSLLKKWGFSENDKIVISLRSLDSIYNIETLIKAVPIVVEKIPSVKFVIAGLGAEEKNLKKMAESLGLFKSINFTGWVDKEDLPEILRTADVYVSTSLSDAGLSSSTAEAMACGLPVVITDFGDNRKWVINNQGGYLISMKNPKDLADKIVELLKNEPLRKDFGETNVNTIRERNNYYKEMAKMEDFYNILTNKI